MRSSDEATAGEVKFQQPNTTARKIIWWKNPYSYTLAAVREDDLGGPRGYVDF